MRVPRNSVLYPSQLSRRGLFMATGLQNLRAVGSRWARVRLWRGLTQALCSITTPQKGSRRWQLFSHFLRVLKWVLFLGMSMCGRLVFWAQKIHLFLSCKNVFFMPNRYWFLKYLAFSSGTDSLKKKNMDATLGFWPLDKARGLKQCFLNIDFTPVLIWMCVAHVGETFQSHCSPAMVKFSGVGWGLAS